jgi:hypothetical protein
MNNLNIKYQLPSGEWHELSLDSQKIIEALIEKGTDGVMPFLVTTVELSTRSQCGKSVKITLLNNSEFNALTEIE